MSKNDNLLLAREIERLKKLCQEKDTIICELRPLVHENDRLKQELQVCKLESFHYPLTFIISLNLQRPRLKRNRKTLLSML